MHLHFLHVLHVLLAHRHHWVSLCQQYYRSMVEHSGYNSGSFDQPVGVSIHILSEQNQGGLTRLQERETWKFVDKGADGPVAAYFVGCCCSKHHTIPSDSSILRNDFGFSYGLVADLKDAV